MIVTCHQWNRPIICWFIKFNGYRVFWEPISQITSSGVSGGKLQRYSSIMRSSFMLKADRGERLHTGIANTSHAIWETILYLQELLFHQPKLSNLSSRGSSRYSYKYLFLWQLGISQSTLDQGFWVQTDIQFINLIWGYNSIISFPLILDSSEL